MQSPLSPRVNRYSSSLLLTILCAAVFTTAAASEPAYLAPGAAEVGGVHHLCLIYHGQQAREKWTADALLPYVAYVDQQGAPTDWLFDSFLLLEFATDAGASLYHDNGQGPYPTQADWAWLADAWFRSDTGLAGLEGAMAAAGAALSDEDRRAGVVLSVPLPQTSIRAFGPLPGSDNTLDFSVPEDRQTALAWYVDTVRERFYQQDYAHLKLLGFYWTAEGIRESDNELVEWLARTIHAKGDRFYWIPYFNAPGVDGWQQRGFDAMMLQPNHFFHEDSPPARLADAARRALTMGAGVEMEFDDRAYQSELFRQHFYNYLNAGAKYGWMKGSVHGWYEGGGAIKRMLARPEAGRQLYDDLARYVHGDYTPTGQQDLPELPISR
ncbi:MAG: hypothetical protein CMJ58_27980 [Planctomycetaceae bacterium]|nr:hypothetical protein [Planctomycetaceae bacterium]